ncbi:hypothetical protein [Saccharomonospora xinjiangensis]|uniref:hypothetical protein n=1 Tax=Saccharomonospora xinjiangensis TaxID=75294 RepID=UPI00106F36C3|nr:hypothetical protein [Saccharomonospora xinjiangensis]
MIASTRLRRDEFQTPRLSGATDGQTSRAVDISTSLVVALGIGVATTATPAVLIGHGLAMAQLGRPTSTSLPRSVFGTMTGIRGIVAALSPVVPAAVMLRQSSRASSGQDHVG